MIICITGMHRSGTSLVASWLESCGLIIHNGEFWGPSFANPKGHFEDKDFVDLHSSAIRLESPKSYGWKVFSKSFLACSDAHSSWAYELVSRRNLKYGTWGWKDPRSVVFLKQWKATIPELKVLLVWRPCSEVVQSLIRRSRKTDQAHLKITLLESVALWVYYNERVCEYKQQFPNDALLLPLDYVISHDQLTLTLLDQKFQTNLTYHPISDLYDPALLHKESTPLLIRLVSLYYGSSKVEKRLQKLSDAQPC